MKDIKNKKWFNNAVSICIGILFFVVLQHLNTIWGGVTSIFWIISPLIYGLIIAYITAPMIGGIEKMLFFWMKNRKKSWYLSIGIFFILFVAAIIGLSYVIIPQVLVSLDSLINNIESYSDNISKLIKMLTHGKSIDNLDGILIGLQERIMTYLNGASEQATSVGKIAVNFFIDCVIAVYLLAGKNTHLRQVKKVAKLILPEHTLGPTANFLTKCNDIFSKFIVCELVDALIVGVINAIAMNVTGLPYIPLITVVVAVTNLAPTFGPMIGLVIGFLILFIIKPLYAVIFVAIVAVTQFIDAYVIKPKFFGNSMGISGLWIIVSVIIGQRILGAVGMLIAIPVVAILKIIWEEWIVPYLEKKKLKKMPRIHD